MTSNQPKLVQIMESLGHLRSQADASFKKVAAAHPQAVACKPGCDDCCHALFDLAPVEALAIARAFSALERKARREILRRADRAAQDFDKVIALASKASEEERLGIITKARVACPLLIKGRCALYEQRPITCRLYGIPVAIGGQGRTCRLARFQPGRTYPTADMDQVQRRLGELSRLALESVPGLPRRRLDLARVLKQAG